MISERLLKKWRREALEDMQEYYSTQNPPPSRSSAIVIKAQERVLRLTLELLDQYLLKKGR